MRGLCRSIGVRKLQKQRDREEVKEEVAELYNQDSPPMVTRALQQPSIVTQALDDARWREC